MCEWSSGPSPAESPRSHASGRSLDSSERCSVKGMRLGHRRLRNLRELGESRRVAHREIGEDLPVDIDVGALETQDQLVVGDTVVARCRVDADDPETAEVALPGAPMLVGELPGALQSLQRGLVELAASPIVPLCGLEDLAPPGASGNSGLGAWHRVYLRDRLRPEPSGATGLMLFDSWISAFSQHAQDAWLIDRRHHHHAGQATLAGARLSDHAVADSGLSAHDLAGPGDLEALGRGPIGLLL